MNPIHILWVHYSYWFIHIYSDLFTIPRDLFIYSYRFFHMILQCRFQSPFVFNPIFFSASDSSNVITFSLYSGIRWRGSYIAVSSAFLSNWAEKHPCYCTFIFIFSGVGVYTNNGEGKCIMTIFQALGWNSMHNFLGVSIRPSEYNEYENVHRIALQVELLKIYYLQRKTEV